MTTYRFSVYNFTEKEIDQLCQLAAMSGRSIPIDRRRYSRQVIKYALSWRLIYKCEEKLWQDDKPGRYYIHSNFDALSLPIYALWKMVDKIIGERNGFSIAKEQGWKDLNIWPVGNHYSTNRDYNAIYQIMCKLASYNFIIFQAAGSVWNICRLEPEKWITDER